MQWSPIFFLADDDVDDQDLFIDALKEINEGIRCIVASDGLEALKKLRNSETGIPDFIFLDQNMPIMTGVQCLREIKKIDALTNARIVMYSTSAHLGIDHEEAKSLGVDHFFKKTPSFRELVAYLKALVTDK